VDVAGAIEYDPAMHRSDIEFDELVFVFDSNVSSHPHGRKGVAPRDGIVDGSGDGGQDGRTSGSTSARRTILRGTTFNVSQGARPWPLGTSGCGKSTLLTLLYRFYSPDSGSIRLGGNDISAYTTRFVRRAMAVVPQDVVLL
jgi:ABC-type multidrug transport system fused ATPase/permease subunit